MKRIRTKKIYNKTWKEKKLNEIKKKEKQHRRASEFRKQRSEILGTVYKNCLTSSQSHSLFMHAHTYTRIKYHIYANMKIFNQILANEERTSALTIRFCVLLLFLSLSFFAFFVLFIPRRLLLYTHFISGTQTLSEIIKFLVIYNLPKLYNWPIVLCAQ